LFLVMSVCGGERKSVPVRLRYGDTVLADDVVVQSYDELIELLGTIGFDLETIKLFYIDDEGDSISVKCTSDIAEGDRTSKCIGESVLSLNVEGHRPEVEHEEGSEDEGKGKNEADFSAQCLASIESLQRQIQTNLREIQNLTSLLESSASRSSLNDDVKKPQIPEEPSPVPIESEERSNPEHGDEEVKEEEEEESIIAVCDGASKKVAKLCKETSTSDADQLSSAVSQKCQTLFDESCANTAEHSSRQSQISLDEARDVVALVRNATDRLLDEQKGEHFRDEASLKRAKELAQEVDRICADLSRETVRSCGAITRCVTEMVTHL